MKLFYTLVTYLKTIYYGKKGEPFSIAGKKYFFQPNSRPTRLKYLNTENTVNRNDILQFLYILNNVKPDSVFWDIGAHYGTISVVAAALIEKENSIFAFEPDVHSIKILLENIKYNRLASKVVVKKQALGDFIGISKMDIGMGASLSRVNTEHDSSLNQQVIEVEMTTLDFLYGSIARPDFVKIDIEGAELLLFKEGKEILADKRVKFICELHPFAWSSFPSSSFQEFRDTIEKSGRNIEYLDSNNQIDHPVYGIVTF